MQAEWDATLRSTRLEMGLGLALAAGSVGLSLLTFLAAREVGGRWYLLGGGFMAGLALFGRANARWHQARRAKEEAAGSNGQ